MSVNSLARCRHFLFTTRIEVYIYTVALRVRSAPRLFQSRTLFGVGVFVDVQSLSRCRVVCVSHLKLPSTAHSVTDVRKNHRRDVVFARCTFSQILLTIQTPPRPIPTGPFTQFSHTTCEQ